MAFSNDRRFNWGCLVSVILGVILLPTVSSCFPRCSAD